MRILLAAIAAACLLAGCSGDSTSSDPADDLPTEIQLVRDLPAPIAVSASVGASVVNPASLAGADPCDSPTVSCLDYPFTVNASRLPDNITAEQAAGINQTEAPDVPFAATLTWSVPSNDFDLYVLAGADTLGSSIATPPGTSETVTGDLPAGEYVVRVVAYSVAQDTFALQVNFG